MKHSYITPSYSKENKFDGIICNLIANLMIVRFGATAGGYFYEEGKTYYNNVPMTKGMLEGQIIPILSEIEPSLTREMILNSIVFHEA